MGEYIDRKALGIGKCNPDIFEDKGYANGWNSAIKIIEEAPTVDVEPVKHGHWIFKKRIKLVPTGQIVVAEDRTALALKKHITVKVPYCSICGERGDCEEDATPYCPNCGAKMDGESND